MDHYPSASVLLLRQWQQWFRRIWKRIWLRLQFHHLDSFAVLLLWQRFLNRLHYILYSSHKLQIHTGCPWTAGFSFFSAHKSSATRSTCHLSQNFLMSSTREVIATSSISKTQIAVIDSTTTTARGTMIGS